MDITDDFDLNSALDHWIEVNCSKEDLTPSNIEEMRDHMLLTTEELVEEKDLTMEEAFAVTKVRFGNADDWAEEMKIMNEDNFQLRKVVFLFGGILAYFILYHFIISSAELLYFWLDYYNDKPAQVNILRMKQYVIVWYFITMLGIVAIFFMKNKIVKILSHIKIRAFHIVLLLGLLLVLFFLGRHLRYESVELFDSQTRERAFFLKTLSQISYLYPVLFSVGFILLFLRFKKTFYV